MQRIVVAVGVLVSWAAHADPDPKYAMIAVRAELPGVMHLANRDSFQIVGAALALRFGDLVEIDGGFAYARDLKAAHQRFVNGGVSLRLATGKRWSLRAPVQVGVRDVDGTGYDMFAITAVTGIDASAWLGPVGLQLRAVGFAGPQWASKADNNNVEQTDRLTYGLTLSAGLCVGW